MQQRDLKRQTSRQLSRKQRGALASQRSSTAIKLAKPLLPTAWEALYYEKPLSLVMMALVLLFGICMTICIVDYSALKSAYPPLPGHHIKYVHKKDR